MERAEIKFDDVVVVAGCGPIGLGTIAGSKAKNPRLVIGLDLSQTKLELAKQCGADVIINSDDKELDVRGAHLGPHCWPAAIKMIESGRLPMDKICTHQLPWSGFRRAWTWSPQATGR